MTSDEIANKISEYNGTIQLVDIMFTGCLLRQTYKLGNAITEAGLMRLNTKKSFNAVNAILEKYKNVIANMDEEVIRELMKAFPVYTKQYLAEGGSVLNAYMFEAEKQLDFDSLIPQIQLLTAHHKNSEIANTILMAIAIAECGTYLVNDIVKEARSICKNDLGNPNFFIRVVSNLSSLARTLNISERLDIIPTAEHLSHIIICNNIDPLTDKCFGNAVHDYFEFALACMILEMRQNKRLLPKTKASLLLLLSADKVNRLEQELKRTRIATSTDDVFDIKDCIHRMKKTEAVKDFLAIAPTFKP